MIRAKLQWRPNHSCVMNAPNQVLCENRMREIRMSGLMRERARGGHWLCLSFRTFLSTLPRAPRLFAAKVANDTTDHRPQDNRTKTMGDYAKVVIRLMRWSGGRLSVVW
jgi:hypothetical protein